MQRSRTEAGAHVGEVPAGRLGAAAVGLIAGCAVLIAYTVLPQMPTSSVTLPAQAALKPSIIRLLPEGWAFFTRSPREADLLPFTQAADGGWRLALRSPHAEPRNLFGLNRASRAQGVELGLVEGAIAQDAWKDCTQPVTACLAGLTPVAVENRSPSPTLCGPVGLAQQPPVPWAWSRDGSTTTMPSKVVRLEMRC